MRLSTITRALGFLIFLGAHPAFAIQKELSELFNQVITADKFDGQKIIAVIPFQTGEGIEKDAGLTVAEYAVVSFQGAGKYRVVERSHFEKVLNELELGNSDLVDEGKQLEMGKLLVADRIVVGSVTEAFGKRTISARIVDVQTGNVLSTGSTVVGPAAMDDFMKELLGEKGQVSAALFRSAVAPGWGQFYTNHPVRGSISLVAFLGAAGFAAFSWVQSSSGYADYESYEAANEIGPSNNPVGSELQDRLDETCGLFSGTAETNCRNEEIAATEKEIDKKYDDYSTKFNRALLATGLVGGVYALNLLDATLAGLSAKKKFNLYFSGLNPANGSFEPTLRVAYRF